MLNKLLHLTFKLNILQYTTALDLSSKTIVFTFQNESDVHQWNILIFQMYFL